MGKAIRESFFFFKYGLEKVPNLECSFGKREKGLFLSVYVDYIYLAGKKQNINPMWKVLVKGVDLGETTSFFDHVYFGCTQRECQIIKDIVDNHNIFSIPGFLLGAWKTNCFREIGCEYFLMVL